MNNSIPSKETLMKQSASGVAAPDALQKITTNLLNHTAKSPCRKRWFETSTAGQYRIILDNAPCGSTKHTHEWRMLGVMQPAARIKELRERYGYPIYCVARVTIYDSWGFPHRNVASYQMCCPQGEEAKP